jgi:hypothetical protein
VLQDGTNTYVYGLDPSAGSGQALISATDGSGVQTYHLYDATRSQSGTGDTDFKFTGEQLDVESGTCYRPPVSMTPR